MAATAALVQMRVDGGEKDTNLQRAAAKIRDAADRGADLAVLPEALNLGWTHPSATVAADAIPDGRSFQRLADAARDNALFVCAGLVERDGDHIYNSAVLVDPAGRLRLLHRKINELEISRDLYDTGDTLGVCDTDLGTVGVHVCADAAVEHQPISRSLACMGSDVILSPSAWALDAEHDNEDDSAVQLWRDSYVPVAEEYSTWLIGVSTVGWLEDGPWAGRKCIGSSLAISPTGEEVVCAPYGPDAETTRFVELA